MPTPDDPLLTELEAASYLNISVYWLQKVRSQGRPGPAVTYVGAAVRYRRSSLERYLQANTSQQMAPERLDRAVRP